LRRIVRGGADDSYGVEVAKLAGVPSQVLSRAKQILHELENGDSVSLPKSGKKTKPSQAPEGQMTFTPDHHVELIGRLKALDVNSLTPIECMNVLFELSKLAKL
jgi:DNA mismatch repair protein MutS